MSSNTKIFLLKKRELIYTGIFLFFGIIFITLLFLMFRPSSSGRTVSQKNYTPGIYTSQISLNNSIIDLEIRTGKNTINSIHMKPISESVTATFPLIEPALDKLTAQICSNQSTENIYYEASQQYTSQMLLSTIKKTLKKAQDIK